MTDQPQPPESGPAGYTAVIYFHGMGSQRRFEESSRLIDAIDLYLSNSYKDRGEKLGILARIKPRIEPDRNTDGGTVTYIRTRYAEPDLTEKRDAAETRVYEAYWAPIMADSRSPMGVAKWILRQVLRPFQTLRGPWRERHRLRRAALAELKERGSIGWPADIRPGDFDKLLRDYDGFEKLNVIADLPDGSFADFRTFVERTHQNKPETSRRLLALARAWYRLYRQGEYRNAFVLITIFLTILLTGGLLIWPVLLGLQYFSSLPFSGGNGGIIADFIRSNFSPSFSTALGLVTSGLMALGLGRFLTGFMGDVEAWATYEETDEKHQKRRRVLEECCDLVRHVLADGNCKRVIIVSHSLGTSVAHDTMLKLARGNRATNAQDPISGPVQLEKIRHFVTIASPIDKINYFFESTRSSFHRYLRVIENLRGDISKAPFAKNRHPHVHWVNFWDEADVISGALHSPVGRQSLINRVDNVHIANLHAPDPGASHSAYFRNRQVISKLFEMIYLNRFSFEVLPMRDDGKGYNYDAAMIGPGERKGLHRMYFIAALSLPWVGLLYLILALAGAGALSKIALVVLIALAGGLALKMLVKKCQGIRRKL